MLYPVKIVALDMTHTRNGPHVRVEWYYGNIYSKQAGKPAEPPVIYPAHRCACAIEEQRGDFSFEEVSADQVSDISLSL